jgi:hypothetical protein
MDFNLNKMFFEYLSHNPSCKRKAASESWLCQIKGVNESAPSGTWRHCRLNIWTN